MGRRRISSRLRGYEIRRGKRVIAEFPKNLTNDEVQNLAAGLPKNQKLTPRFDRVR